jgi:hypothetical protein
MTFCPNPSHSWAFARNLNLIFLLHAPLVTEMEIEITDEETAKTPPAFSQIRNSS